MGIISVGVIILTCGRGVVLYSEGEESVDRWFWGLIANITYSQTQ